MGFYQDKILPYVIHLAMRQRNLAAYRGRVVPAAEGRVLEIGIGSGLNLPFYSQKVEQVIGLDPSANLLSMARQAARPSLGPVELVEGSAEAIPLESRTVDTVVTTWTLCSIPDAPCSLLEMRRVLKPGGVLLADTFLIDQAALGHPRDPRFMLGRGELRALTAGLEVEDYREGEVIYRNGTRAFRASILARRKKSR